jgi:molybdopterin-guanine dinucleotide biosynthesis adapter protein
MTVPLLAIAAWSGTGKTTLLEKVIPLLRDRGIRSGLIKHTHHHMDVDTPGKDSYLLRKAGADQVIVTSNQRWALMCETPDEPLNLHQLAARMDHALLDLVLVEGFKDEPVAKIVLWRTGVKGTIADLLDDYVIAVASDVESALPIPVLDINQPQQIADFIAEWCFSQKNP